MKRVVSVLAVSVLLIWSAFPAGARERVKQTYIVKGGFNYSGVSGLQNVQNLDLGEYSGFNVGAAVKIDLPLAFSIQPEVLFYMAGTKAHVSTGGSGTVDGKLYNENLYVPINVQWGPKMGMFRVYAQVSPFFGFTMSNRLQYNDPEDGMKTIKVLTKNTNVLMGGIGAGIGFEVWKIQLSIKYNWNFNRLFSDLTEGLDQYFQSAKMRGLEISAGFMF